MCTVVCEPWGLTDSFHRGLDFLSLLGSFLSLVTGFDWVSIATQDCDITQALNTSQDGAAWRDEHER
jgi:hypothetical protein